MWGGARDEYEEINNHSQVLDHCPNGVDNSRARVSVSGPTNAESSTEAPSRVADNNNDHQLNVNHEVIYEIYGYRFSLSHVFLFYFLLAVCPLVGLILLLYHNLWAFCPLLGLPHLLVLWFPIIRTLRYEKCDVAYSDYMLLRNNFGLLKIIPVYWVHDAKLQCDGRVPPFATCPELDSEEESERYFDERCDTDDFRYFDFEEIRYSFDPDERKFVPLRMPHEGAKIKEICDNNNHIRVYDWMRQHNLDLYGLNKIRVDVKSYWRLFTEEIINPFYLFQIFSITLWSLDDYYYYAACVLTLSVISIGTSLYQTKRQSITLRELVEKSRPQSVTIVQFLWRDNPSRREISPERLIPGDVLMIENGMILPCDCLLVEGSCIVNECMLTGESVPVNKIAVDPTDEGVFNENRYKRNILYAGTEVIQVKNNSSDSTRARVLNVGFFTAQGQLIKSILFPKPIGFKFYKDSMRFVMVLFCCAVFGMLYSVRLYLRRNQDIKTMIFGTLDVITIIVPPSLPMAMTAGTIYSQNRLKRLGISCVSPPQINVCGKMKLCCFDKTGTLTEDGLTYMGHLNVGVHGGIHETLKQQMPMNLFDKLVQGMATCHSLIPHDNDLLGDPLDLEMFRHTDWQLMEAAPHLPAPRSVIPKSEIGKSLEHDLPYVIGIYKDFEFTSERQSMSVIVQILGHDNFILFAKGAPEKIRESLVDTPPNFDAVLNRYAKSGYRVLALAYKEFEPRAKLTNLLKKSRDALEKELYFLGFVVFENSLKPETISTVADLKRADLRVVMATGDNILTAVAVARESGIVADEEKIFQLDFDSESNSRRLAAREVGQLDGMRRRRSREGATRVVMDEPDEFPHHFAMDGRTWEAMRRRRPDLIPRILTRGTIFARFRPEQKSELVLGLQDMDYIVTMCGDGANDCTALKAANIGVSLSQAEASVAAPFTYNKQNIECVKHLALEGRCALVTSFAIFKYMILYSVIQFCTVLILYTYCTTLGNFQFLFIDLVITASIAFSMGLQEPMGRLGAKRPSSSLISPNNVIPLVIQIITCVGMQLGATMLLTNQWWYPDSDVEQRCLHNETMAWRLPIHGGLASGEKPIVCWENTVVFLTSCFQYLVLGLMYSKGKPFRKPFYTNITFMAIFVTLMTFTLLLLLQPPEPLAEFFELQSIADSTAEENIFRYYLLLFPLVHIFAAMVIELGMAERRWLKKLCHVITQKRGPRNKFRLLENEFSVDPDWIIFKEF